MVRFVRVAADERAATTFALLAERFEVLGGAPRVELADRMGCCSRGGVVAGQVVPTPDYLRFATHYGFGRISARRMIGIEGIVEHLVGYAKRDLLVPQALFADLGAATRPRGCGVVRSTPW